VLSPVENAAREPGAPVLLRETRESEYQRAGLLVYDVPPAWVERAKTWRARRDNDFHDHDVYEREETDERWVGELGEMVFDWWIRSEGVTDLEWITTLPAGKPDFRIQSARVGVKTVKRRGGFYRGYCGQVSARHIEEPVDSYFFLSYQWCLKDPGTGAWRACSRMWLAGGVSQRRFRRCAHRTEGPATDPCNPEYRVRAGHTIYNAYERDFTVPREWLRLLRARFPGDPPGL
jgi:hypothetical protein